MTAAWLRVRGGESVPDFRCGGGGGEKRLHRRRDGAEQGTVDQLILSLPQHVIGVDGYHIINCNRLWWDLKRSINVACQIIATKEGENLTIPHNIVCGSQFGDISHVDIKQRAIVGDSNGLVKSSRRFIGHGGRDEETEGEEEEEKVGREKNFRRRENF